MRAWGICPLGVHPRHAALARQQPELLGRRGAHDDGVLPDDARALLGQLLEPAVVPPAAVPIRPVSKTTSSDSAPTGPPRTTSRPPRGDARGVQAGARGPQVPAHEPVVQRTPERLVEARPADRRGPRLRRRIAYPSGDRRRRGRRGTRCRSSPARRAARSWAAPPRRCRRMTRCRPSLEEGRAVELPGRRLARLRRHHAQGDRRARLRERLAEARARARRTTGFALMVTRVEIAPSLSLPASASIEAAGSDASVSLIAR
jgi:hypothetical protein